MGSALSDEILIGRTHHCILCRRERLRPEGRRISVFEMNLKSNFQFLGVIQTGPVITYRQFEFTVEFGRESLQETAYQAVLSVVKPMNRLVNSLPGKEWLVCDGSEGPSP